MMPNMQGGGGMGPGGPGGGPQVPAGPGGQDQPNPDTIKKQLVMLLTQAKKMAEANGVNFNDVISAVEGEKGKADIPMPRPPSGL
jgi:hypothetical protein